MYNHIHMVIEPSCKNSHMNEALAHPLGANFKEVISVLEFNYNLIKLNLKFLELKLVLIQLVAILDKIFFYLTLMRPLVGSIHMETLMDRES